MTGTFGKPSAVVSLATALLAGVPAGFTIWWLVGMCVSLIQLNTTAEKRIGKKLFLLLIFLRILVPKNICPQITRTSIV
jgi:NhaP-type Na+/H+ or K+/H+ antiporter